MPNDRKLTCRYPDLNACNTTASATLAGLKYLQPFNNIGIVRKSLTFGKPDYDVRQQS